MKRKRTYSEISQDKIKLIVPEESSCEKKLNYASVETESQPQTKSHSRSDSNDNSTAQAEKTPGRSYEILDEMSSAWMNDDLGTFEDSDDDEAAAAHGDDDDDHDAADGDDD